MANDFDDPFAPADGTVMRPRPGGARRPASDGQSQVRPAAPPPRGGQEYGPAPTPGNLAVQDFISGGRNPILQAAGPLIAVASRLQSTVANADINALRTQAMQDVRQFDDRGGLIRSLDGHGSAPLRSAAPASLNRQIREAFMNFGSDRLTEREREIAHLLLRGHSAKSSAKVLEISPETVRMHRKNLYTKLEIGSQAELFALFIDWLTA